MLNLGDAGYVLNLMDDFYSSIEMPEGTSVSLEALYHSAEGSPSHIMNFIGPVDGLVALRALRSGDAYDALIIQVLKNSQQFYLLKQEKHLLEFQELMKMFLELKNGHSMLKIK